MIFKSTVTIVAHLCLNAALWINDVLTVDRSELFSSGTERSWCGTGSIGSIGL